VFSRYLLAVEKLPVGQIRNLPPLSASRRAPNREGLSNRGQQSQSREPSFEISAMLPQSPIAA
jgi:hypothetical protein